ncbi:MAG: hypothetical protein WA839_09105 [Flavobacteriaceae bacterium]
MNFHYLLNAVILSDEKYYLLYAVIKGIMQQLSSIFGFYRPFILWSFAINVFLSLIGYSLVPIFLVKLLLTLFLWYFLNETSAKRKLVFYKNLGISTFKLFFFLYLIDLFLSLPFLLILKEFI